MIVICANQNFFILRIKVLEKIVNYKKRFIN